MSHTIRDLRAATDEELIDLHDAIADNVFPSVNYYLDELRRRDQARAMESSHRLAVASFWRGRGCHCTG
jgi:hypothetical protein